MRNQTAKPAPRFYKTANDMPEKRRVRFRDDWTLSANLVSNFLLFLKWNVVLFSLAGMWSDCRAADASLITVFQDDTHQFTGVAISESGRMFVNYPRWLPGHQYDVVEVMPNR